MTAEWKHGLAIAAERGLVAIDFPDLVRVRVSDNKWISALVSFAGNYIVVQDSVGSPPVYRVYPLDFTGTLVEFIASEIENPSIPVARNMETIKRLFLKWKHVYSFSPWIPLSPNEE